jgi:hypothetical protein
MAGLVEGDGDGFAEGVGADPGEFVGFGGLGGVVDLGDEAVEGVEAHAVDGDEVGDELVVDLDAAGFDEFDAGLGPAEAETGAMVGCSDARGPARYEVAVTVRNSVM